MSQAAGEVFTVALESQRVPTAIRIAKGAGRIVGALLSDGRDTGVGDTSARHYRVVVRDQGGAIVHEQNWRGDV